MSVCKFIASDMPLAEFRPSQEYPYHVNIDEGTIYDGGADDNYFLFFFKDVDLYTEREYGVYLEWDYTEGRARQIIEYIKKALEESESVEFWSVWLMDYYEYEDRPYIHRTEISIDELTVEDIKKINDAEIWNKSDKMNPERPSYYCITITR